MKIHGMIYYQGFGYDENGHTDDYNLMFEMDNGITIDLNDIELEEFKEVSIFDKFKGTLEVNFIKD